MIEITIEELLKANSVLRDLSSKSFSGSTAFKIARLIREFEKEIILFEEAKEKMANKYGLRKEDGSLEILADGTVKIQEDKIQECNSEILNLLKTKIKINADKISSNLFDQIEITPLQILDLDILIN